jgi:hypothetical protein
MATRRTRQAEDGYRRAGNRARSGAWSLQNPLEDSDGLPIRVARDYVLGYP